MDARKQAEDRATVKNSLPSSQSRSAKKELVILKEEESPSKLPKFPKKVTSMINAITFQQDLSAQSPGKKRAPHKKKINLPEQSQSKLQNNFKMVWQLLKSKNPSYNQNFRNEEHAWNYVVANFTDQNLNLNNYDKQAELASQKSQQQQMEANLASSTAQVRHVENQILRSY